MKRVRIRARWWEKSASTAEPFVLIADDGTVTLEDGGAVLGRIRKGTRTWERRPYKGARYVSARGSVVEWQGWTPDERGVRPNVWDDTRVGVLRKLYDRHITEKKEG